MPPKRRSKSKYKKAPGAPLRFKSAYMFFNIAKQKEIRSSVMQGEKLSTTKIAKMVSHAWKSLSAEQRAVWEEMAVQDRARFEVEKQNYTGPWKVQTGKDPRAPRRPMSAFLDFSNSQRAQFRKIYPHATNGEISSMLAKEWKEAPPEVKSEYIEREARLRGQYKKDLAAWEEANARGEDIATDDFLLGEGDADDFDGDADDDGNQEEDERKPPAVERKSTRHGQEPMGVDERSTSPASSERVTTGATQHRNGEGDTRFDSEQFPASQQLVVSNYARLPGSHREQQAEDANQSNNATLSGQSEQVLRPLISTDVGGFLAAAAALSASSEDSPLPTSHSNAPPTPAPDAYSEETSPSERAPRETMNARVREVVSQLPYESMKDTDLPKTPSD